MSPKIPGHGAGAGNGNSLDASLNRAIEAMSHLREDLRREGHFDLADCLDDTLIKCLKFYADRDTNGANEGEQGEPNGSKNPPS
jgi:hypothetical protein